jgi:hypothetical protein
VPPDEPTPPKKKPNASLDEILRRLSEQARSINKNAFRAAQTDLLAGLDRGWATLVRHQSEQLQRALASSVSPALEQWSLQFPKIDLSAWVDHIRPAIEGFRRAWEEALPPNWQDFSIGEVTNTIDRVETTGYCLVWVPRAEIVREVLAADASHTAQILLTQRDHVLDDVEAVLADVTEPTLSPERDAALAAARSFRAGHHQAAQALASSVFTSAVHRLFAMGTKATRKRMAETHPEEARIQQLRLRTIFLAGTRALDEFRPDKARPVRSEFNRHNTAHRITVEQWTEANALCAIMLSTGLVRELDYWLKQGGVVEDA